MVLYVTPPGLRNNDEINHKLPAIDFTAEIEQKVNANAVIFKVGFVILKISIYFSVFFSVFHSAFEKNNYHLRGKVAFEIMRFHRLSFQGRGACQ